MPPSNLRSIIGIDVGGANLKLARWTTPDTVESISQVFPLWKQPDQLGQTVARLIEPWQDDDVHLAVTMTGELADCYASRRIGVAAILDALCGAVPKERIDVYSVDRQWLSIEHAKQQAWSVAASNWHALACWLGDWPATSPICQRGVLLDIGSTTVDIIPLENGQPATKARTDRQRLEQRQLIYTGMRRTPVCAIAPTLRLNDVSIPTMAEWFATTDDAYLLLGLVDEDEHDTETADGQPRTVAAAHTRMARMIGEDAESLSLADAKCWRNKSFKRKPVTSCKPSCISRSGPTRR